MIRLHPSLFRKHSLHTRVGFDGVGVLVSCDPKTRKAPYVHRIEEHSPGMASGLRKSDFILSINDVDVVNMDFELVISLLKEHIANNDLFILVGNKKAFKKWNKIHSSKKFFS